jgi:catechol 2,3-dioxygenase-like lactoylglutathione lyase family enzyme
MRTLLAALLLLLVPPAPAAAAASTSIVTAVDAVAIPVTDMDRAVAFYTGVLGFRQVADREVAGSEYERLFGVFGLRLRRVRLQLGGDAVELTQFLAPRGRPLPQDTRANDRWFQHIAIIVDDLDAAYAWLRRHGVEHASSGPQVLPDWNPAAGGIGAFYFRDPDGNFLEILQFPPGKGDPRWQSKESRFLGIDHTAIVVADTEASLRYYRDLLGLTVVGGSENYGTEQEHLNNVFGARLRITTLRAPQGPGVELLEYLTPRTGRPAPVDTSAADGWQWQVVLTGADLGPLWDAARSGRAEAVSPGVVTVDGALGFGAGMVMRDPDRHADLVILH